MLVIRNLISNRNSFLLLLVLFLCVITATSSVLYAAGPLLIFGIPAAKFAWGVVSGALAAITIWQTADMLIKDLDEKIADLEKAIPKLVVKQSKLWDIYEGRRDARIEWEGKLRAAESELSMAESNLSTAEGNVSSAQYSYDISSDYASKALTAYMNHTSNCSQCMGSILCPTGRQTYDSWQSWDKQSKKDKKALDNAKKALKDAKKAKGSAESKVSNARYNVSIWTGLANSALTAYNNATQDLTNKSNDLVSKGVEKTINEATREAARGDIDSANQSLDAAETHYPDAWSEAMQDDDLRRQVDFVRSQ